MPPQIPEQSPRILPKRISKSQKSNQKSKMCFLYIQYCTVTVLSDKPPKLSKPIRTLKSVGKIELSSATCQKNKNMKNVVSTHVHQIVDRQTFPAGMICSWAWRIRIYDQKIPCYTQILWEALVGVWDKTQGRNRTWIWSLFGLDSEVQIGEYDLRVYFLRSNRISSRTVSNYSTRSPIWRKQSEDKTEESISWFPMRPLQAQ